MKTFWLISSLALLLQAAPQATGTVQGTIVRAGSAEPLADVRVTLVQGNFPADLPLEFQLQIQQQPGRTAISDNAGNFVLRNVPVGRYTLFVQREGFSGSAATTPVTVTADKTSEVNLSLIPGAVIRGRVLDSTGRFLSNVGVQAFSLAYVNGLPILQPSVSKSTDDRGEYRLFGVPPGEYYIGVAPRAPIANTAPSSGTVRNVRTFHPSSTSTTTATRIVAKSGEEITGIDIVMQSSLHVRITGRVISEVAPPPPNAEAPGVFAIISNTNNNSANLMLVPRNSSIADDPGARLATTVLLSTREFQIQNVVPGPYDLFALVNSQQGFALGRVPVDVLDRDVADIVVVVRPGVEVRGTITIDGKPDNTQSVRVSLQPTDSLVRITGDGGPPVQQQAGTFSIASVPDGHFRIVAYLPGNLYLDDVLQSVRSVYDSGIEIRSGVAPESLEIAVRSGGGTVSGNVLDAAKKPLARATVALVPNERRTNPALYRSAVSDANGRFQLSGVAPGEYKLFAWAGATNGAHFNAEFLAKYEERGLPVNVASGARVNSDVSALYDESR